ncbi:SufE family protein [Parapusillimonas granuli]|uniref:SufE family protein n=1 Tax=Parapusillimonas granuli TaxID=380911 RepID=A0A853G9G5_9BURK|nr:SufE family protein [Parapusillimonas granuli]MBB5217487.1 cysteine desulfuration protein SufE [Parapusillimonas granuli]NYT51251.1 SufE family protein [Parapusillimonas granuli]
MIAPPDTSLEQNDIQTELVEVFACMPDWPQRYQYLIDLGRTVQTFPERDRTEANRLHGCQASVWLKHECRQGRIHYTGASDSMIVSGLMALLFRIYSGKRFDEAWTTLPWCFEAMGLNHHLTAQRATGLSSMVARMRDLALQCAQASCIDKPA